MSGRTILILRPNASIFGAGRLQALPDTDRPLGGRRMSMRTGGHSCWPGRGSRRPCGTWFTARDFVEVETAILQASPGNEAHLHAFATELIAPDGRRTPLYLHTSPEFACKKLLAAGEQRLFTFARVFPQPRARRAASSGVHHAGMVSGERTLRAADRRLRCAAGRAAETAGTQAVFFRGREADPFAEPERLTVAEAFGGTRVSICWRLSMIDDALVAAAKGKGIRVAE